MPDSETADFVLYAFDVFADGSARKLSQDGLASAVSPGAAYRWAHLDLAEPGAHRWIEAQTDDVVANALTIEDTRPRCASHKDGLLLNLRGVNLNPGSDPEDMVSIRMWIEKNYVISARLRRLMAVAALREAIEADRAPATIGAFAATLAYSLTERMDGVIGGLSDTVDDLEDKSIDKTAGLRSELAELRRTTIMLRRYVAPQREALSRLSTEAPAFIQERERLSLRECIDRITRIVEELDAIRERSAVLNDQLTDKRAEEMNRNMLILSVVAAIFLPLGFLTGLLGVNIAGIPGANYPYAFAIFCSAVVVLSALLVGFFKWLKWL